MLNIAHKIKKRMHPIPNIKYDLRRSLKGKRPRKIAERYGEPIDCLGASHVHNYMTLNCNLHCAYCINRQIVETYPKFEKHDWQEWSTLLNRMWNVRELYFNGGEHFILPYFVDLLNSLNSHNILIFSNLPKTAMERIQQLQPGTNNIFLDISYHPYQDDPVNLFVERLRQIPKNINWNIHVIKTPEVSTYLILDAFRRYGIYGVALEGIWYPQLRHAPIEPVQCKSNEHIIGPDMKIYRCLVEMLYGVPGVLVKDYNWEMSYHPCNYFPRCKVDCAYMEIQYDK